MFLPCNHIFVVTFAAISYHCNKTESNHYAHGGTQTRMRGTNGAALVWVWLTAMTPLNRLKNSDGQISVRLIGLRQICLPEI